MNDCTKCGDCCREIMIHFERHLRPAEREYYYTRGFTIYPTVIGIHIPCPHLTTDNLCAIYDVRPQVCMEAVCKK